MDYAVELDIAVKPTTPVPGLGKEYGYYVGAGNPLFSVGGGVLRTVLKHILHKYHAKRGYYVVETPLLARTTLYEVTGHLQFYKENMFLVNIEGDEYAIKPMNCPFHVLIFMNLLQKYQAKVALPFKIFETGTVHRYEIAGALRGLLRVRAFTQDDAHIFAREEDVEQSLIEVFDMMKDVYEKLFHIPVTSETVRLRLSLSAKDKIGSEFMGEPEMWRFSEEKLFKVAEEIKRRYGIEFFAEEGEAAFYGPKLDVVVFEEDGKEWQIGTAQFDFNLPMRFKLNELLRETHGLEGNIYMIHRALLGSLERFIGIYLEMYKGRLPFVLAPLQALVVGILTGKEDVDSKIKKLVEEAKDKLLREEIRASSLYTTKTHLSKDVRKVESTVKPPLMIYVGQREAEKGLVTVRPYSHAERRRLQRTVSINEIMEVVSEMEEGVKALVGAPVRLPADPSYMT
ncbi:MAG: hypothetical protein GXO07_04050 [Crenarchaeota archaeon]|nr:hypothetical protein [Thermoproteota archaeon]